MVEVNRENGMLRDLEIQFPFVKDKVRLIRVRRLLMEVERAKVHTVTEYLKNRMKFLVCCTITGQDEGENFSLTYHLAQMGGIVLNLRTLLPKTDPVIHTISSFFPGAVLYERELIDLFGIKVEGLAEGKRYPLPDDWPLNQHPLRKDWKPEGTVTPPAVSK